MGKIPRPMPHKDPVENAKIQDAFDRKMVIYNCFAAAACCFGLLAMLCLLIIWAYQL